MNVIVSNKQKDVIDNVNIDAIKDLNGLFNIDDLISKFKNYFFSKMILDATSIINFSSKEVLEKLASEIGGERLIILLPPSPEPPQEFINKLIDLKIYNFSTKIEDVVRFLTNPNTAETFANSGYNNDEQIYVDNSIKANNDFNSMPSLGGMGVNTASMNNFNNGGLSQNYTMPQDSFGMNNISQNMNGSLNGNSIVGINQPNFNSNIPVGIPQVSNNQNIPVGIPQTSNNQNIPVGIPQNSNQMNSFGNPQGGFNPMNNQMAMQQGGFNPMNNMGNQFGQPNNISPNGSMPFNRISQPSLNQGMMNGNNPIVSNNQGNINMANGVSNNFSSGIYNGDKKVYGVKNVTLHAGSTTLIYMLMKAVRDKLGKNVLAIEVDKRDFSLYQEKNNMISVDSNSLVSAIAKSNAEIVFVDLNNYSDYSICNEVLYLVEPSTIKLNALMAKNRYIFKSLESKKVIINMSLLSNDDVKILSSEAGIPFFMNIPPLNDRVYNEIILNLFEKL